MSILQILTEGTRSPFFFFFFLTKPSIFLPHCATGNLLTVVALPMTKKLRTTATAFVVNLAVVEMLFCVFILPMSGAQYLFLQQNNKSLLTDRDCVFFVSLRYSLTQVELQTILAIALTRYVTFLVIVFFFYHKSYHHIYHIHIKIVQALGGYRRGLET